MICSYCNKGIRSKNYYSIFDKEGKELAGPRYHVKCVSLAMEKENDKEK